MPVETVTISLKQYRRLLDSDAQLAHLEAMGVDNWEGYSHFADEDEDEDDDR